MATPTHKSHTAAKRILVWLKQHETLGVKSAIANSDDDRHVTTPSKKAKKNNTTAGGSSSNHSPVAAVEAQSRPKRRNAGKTPKY